MGEDGGRRVSVVHRAHNNHGTECLPRAVAILEAGDPALSQTEGEPLPGAWRPIKETDEIASMIQGGVDLGEKGGGPGAPGVGDAVSLEDRMHLSPHLPGVPTPRQGSCPHLPGPEPTQPNPGCF